MGRVLGFVKVFEVFDLSLEVFFLFGAGNSGVEEVDFFDRAWSLDTQFSKDICLQVPFPAVMGVFDVADLVFLGPLR